MLAVTLGFLTREQVRDLIDEQYRLMQSGTTKRLGEICLEKHLLTKEQLLLVLRAQGKRILACPKCKKSYNVRSWSDTETYACKHCNGTLTEPTRVDTRVHGSVILHPKGDTKSRTKKKTVKVGDSKLRNLLPGYEITGMLGRGGMGIVYKAKDLILKRTVAVKILASDLAKDKEYVERFIREARMAQKLEHPNLIRAYDCGVAERVLFFLMEFVDGETVEELLARKGHLSETRALSYVWQTAEGLDYAWKNRIIHRDIKPGNLMVTKQGVIKICDLGLSKSMESDHTLTLTGQINCTPAYASPEQGRGMREIDARSDVYSLGCTLYQMLTGEFPFVGEGPGDLILKHSTEARPDPRAVNPQVSKQAAVLTMRMMAVPADERPFPGEVARALRKHLDGAKVEKGSTIRRA